MNTKLVAGIFACTLVLGIAVEAQQTSPPLAEVARKEAERRKGIKDTKKVITTKDLPESARKPKTASGESGTAAPNTAPPEQRAGAQAAEGQKPADAQKPASDSAPAQGENYWRGRITTAREALRRNESFAEALQSRINALTTDFVNRDNPIQRQQIGEDRQKALDELARVKSEVEAGRRTIADIEEEARKAGVPPGWLR